MAYIGVGWAMARLPGCVGARYSRATRCCAGWRWTATAFAASSTPGSMSPGSTGRRSQAGQQASYANRAVDQGIGRALWFVNGADVGHVAATIEKFDPSRRGDLWSGAALASVYAGGADASELAEMARLAGPHRPAAAQGAAFAGQARLLAGLVTSGTELGVKVFCDMSVAEAAAITDETRQGLPEAEGEVPGYEIWRQRIMKRFD